MLKTQFTPESQVDLEYHLSSFKHLISILTLTSGDKKSAILKLTHFWPGLKSKLSGKSIPL